MQNFVRPYLLLLVLGAASFSFAQQPAPQQPAPPPMATKRPPNPNHQTKELSKKLGLTPDQASKVEPILADRDQKVEALNASTSLDPKSMRQQRRSIMMDSEGKLNAVLTPAQQQQWAAMKADKKHGPPASAPPPPPVG